MPLKGMQVVHVFVINDLTGDTRGSFTVICSSNSSSLVYVIVNVLHRSQIDDRCVLMRGIIFVDTSVRPSDPAMIVRACWSCEMTLPNISWAHGVPNQIYHSHFSCVMHTSRFSRNSRTEPLGDPSLTTGPPLVN